MVQKDGNGHVIPSAEEVYTYETQRHKILLTLTGVPTRIIELKAAQIKRKLEQEQGEIKPPTYKAKVLGGAEEEFVLADDLIVVEGDPQETARRRVAWDEYAKRQVGLQAEIDDASTMISLALGTRFEYPVGLDWESDVEWVMRDPEQPDAPSVIPTDERDKRGWFLANYELTQLEVSAVVQMIRLLSMGGRVSPDDIALFQTILSDQVAEQIARIFANVRRVGAMASQSIIPGGTDGLDPEHLVIGVGQDDGAGQGVSDSSEPVHE